MSKADTPRVEATIDAAMRRRPSSSPAATARYFEDVHQDLAPLARTLERELGEALNRVSILGLENSEMRVLLSTRVEGKRLDEAMTQIEALQASLDRFRGAKEKRS